MELWITPIGFVCLPRHKWFLCCCVLSPLYGFVFLCIHLNKEWRRRFSYRDGQGLGTLPARSFNLELHLQHTDLLEELTGDWRGRKAVCVNHHNAVKFAHQPSVLKLIWAVLVKKMQMMWYEPSPSSSSDSLWLASSLCLSRNSYWRRTRTKRSI